jgi:hypothetical protein
MEQKMIEMEGDNMIEREWRERLQVGSLCIREGYSDYGVPYCPYNGTGLKNNSKALCKTRMAKFAIVYCE